MKPSLSFIQAVFVHMHEWMDNNNGVAVKTLRQYLLSLDFVGFNASFIKKSNFTVFLVLIIGNI